MTTQMPQPAHPDEYGHWNVEDIRRLLYQRDELLNGCNALLGLLQLLTARDDAPFWLRTAVAESHRVAEAVAAVAKATQR